MSTNTIISIVQIIISLLLIVAVLMQSRGGGMGALFGGEGNVYTTKRGAEKFLFWATVVLIVAFLGLSLARFLIV